jgi:hypothetical protein
MAPRNQPSTVDDTFGESKCTTNLRDWRYLSGLKVEVAKQDTARDDRDIRNAALERKQFIETDPQGLKKAVGRELRIPFDQLV